MEPVACPADSLASNLAFPCVVNENMIYLAVVMAAAKEPVSLLIEIEMSQRTPPPPRPPPEVEHLYFKSLPQSHSVAVFG